MSNTAEKQELETVIVTAMPAIVYPENVTEKALKDLKEKYKIVPDASTPEGYEEIKEGLKEMRPLWTGTDKARKALKDDALNFGRKVDAEARRITAVIMAIATPFKEAKETQDAKVRAEEDEKQRIEMERLADIESRINQLKNAAEGLLNADLDQIKHRLDEVNKTMVSEDTFAEFQEPAEFAKKLAIEALTQAVATKEVAVKAEEDAKKVKKQREEEQKENDRVNAIQDRIARFKIMPVDMMGTTVEDMAIAISDLERDFESPLDSFEEFAEDAKTAIRETIDKVKGLMETQKRLDDQQAEIDNNQKAAEPETETPEVKTELVEKTDKPTDSMVDRVSMLKYATDLVSLPAPDVKDPEMIAVLREVSVKLSELHSYVLDNAKPEE